MLRMPVPAFEADARGLVNARMALRFLWVGAAVCLLGALASALEPFDITPTARLVLVGGQAVLGLLCIGATRLIDNLSLRALVLGTAWACVLVATVTAIALGHGAHSLDLSFYPLVICLVAVLVGTGAALAMTLVCAAIVLALALAEVRGWLPGAAALADSPLSHPLTTHGLLLMAGFTVGAIMLRLSNASYGSAQEREARFRGLLAIAAHHYWELDAQLRLRRADDAATLQSSALFADHLSRPLAEIVAAPGDDQATRAAGLDDLRAHRPFAGLRGRLPGADGQPVYLEFSGHPKTDAHGRFAGYWGVAHDVSDQVRADSASRRSESMTQSLFAATPECLTLTEYASGRFLMANQGFLDVFGFSRDEVIGHTSAELGIWASPHERDQLLAALRQHGKVSGMRCRLRTRAGAQVNMLLSSAICGIDGIDTIVINARDVTADDHARQEYAAVLQRASIGIAFTRDHRFAGANPYFERMFGWAEGTLRGQSEAVIWTGPEQHAQIARVAAPLLGRGEPVIIERELTRRDGSTFWGHLRAEALDSHEPLSGGTIWIAEDVTERRRAAQELAATRDAAEAASRAKSAFLANTSHEIRTPLNGLLGLAQLAVRDDVDDARRKAYVAHMLDSARGLSAIITDILDLSKIEAGKLDLEAAPFRLREALEAVRISYLPAAQAKDLELHLAIDGALPATFSGDAVRVRQIVGNFVSNAIKFTERGAVNIRASLSPGGRLRLSVSDSGIGIDADTQQRLFEPFSQADQSTTRRFGGTGLGLSICRELAQLMGGQVGVNSHSGAGSEFWAELPLAQAGEPDPPTSADAVATELRRLRGARVLVAEDNAVNMMIAVALLEQWGVQVSQATDGVAAVEAVLRAAGDGRPFDAVLMDVQMPRLSGHAAARQLRERLEARMPPVIALTAAALVSERDEALRAGMCDFLTKPVDAERMRRVLAGWVGRGQPS